MIMSPKDPQHPIKIMVGYRQDALAESLIAVLCDGELRKDQKLRMQLLNYTLHDRFLCWIGSTYTRMYILDHGKRSQKFQTSKHTSLQTRYTMPVRRKRTGLGCKITLVFSSRSVRTVK